MRAERSDIARGRRSGRTEPGIPSGAALEQSQPLESRHVSSRRRGSDVSAIFGEVLTFGQPNGGDVELKVFGDEHYARYETLDGLHRRLRQRARASSATPACRPACSARPACPSPTPPPAGSGAAPAGGPAGRRRRSSQARRLRRAAVTGGPVHDDVVRTFGPNQGLLEGRVLSTGSGDGPDHPGELPGRHQHRDARPTSTTCSTARTTPATATSARRASTSARVSSGKLDYTNVVVGPVHAEPEPPVLRQQPARRGGACSSRSPTGST